MALSVDYFSSTPRRTNENLWLFHATSPLITILSIIFQQRTTLTFGRGLVRVAVADLQDASARCPSTTDAPWIYPWRTTTLTCRRTRPSTPSWIPRLRVTPAVPRTSTTTSSTPSDCTGTFSIRTHCAAGTRKGTFPANELHCMVFYKGIIRAIEVVRIAFWTFKKKKKKKMMMFSVVDTKYSPWWWLAPMNFRTRIMYVFFSTSI